MWFEVQRSCGIGGHVFSRLPSCAWLSAFYFLLNVVNQAAMSLFAVIFSGD
jgi:hypothetical protein